MNAFTVPALESFPEGGLAVVVGAGGGLGRAFTNLLTESGRFDRVLPLGRGTAPPLDFADEASVETAAATAGASGLDLRLLIDASGLLHKGEMQPEKSRRDLTPENLARAFLINATGPALLMKHFLPLVPREGKACFATLSAKVGSIGDNRIGGWYAYRASKAALNQLIRCAAIELGRRKREALCLALHPGTVDTGLSAPFSKSGLKLQQPRESAARLLAVIDRLDASASGGFYAYDGEALPW